MPVCGYANATGGASYSSNFERTGSFTQRPLARKTSIREMKARRTQKINLKNGNSLEPIHESIDDENEERDKISVTKLDNQSRSSSRKTKPAAKLSMTEVSGKHQSPSGSSRQ